MPVSREYVVRSPIFDGKREYRPGEKISLTEEEAARMPWAVEPPKDKAADEKKKDK